MKEVIIESTIEALKSVIHERFFRTERGYHGGFYCALQSALDSHNLLNDKLILEMEYQKRSSVHGTTQRPDIVLHIPREVTGASASDNNFAVWALKHQGSDTEASSDFVKLNYMLGPLQYHWGVFINIDSDQHRLENYEGLFPDRIIAFAIQLIGSDVKIKQGIIKNGQTLTSNKIL